MKLYTSPLSPFARKVHILALLKDIALEYVTATADIENGYTGGVNALGKIPTLEMDGGKVLVDSPVICEYLDSLHTPLLARSGDERWHQLHLNALGDGLSDAVYNLRYEMARPESLHWPQMIARHEAAIKSTVIRLNEDIDGLGSPWNFSNISIICALDYADFRASHIGWRNLAPKLAEWHKGFTRSSIWTSTNAYNES